MPADLPISARFTVPGHALRVVRTRAGGPGGQNVNTRATRVQLFLDLDAAGLPRPVQARLLDAHGGKLNQAGELQVNSATHRTQDANLKDARDRLASMIQAVWLPPKRRRETRPSRASKERRLTSKSQRSQVKKGRGKVDW